MKNLNGWELIKENKFVEATLLLEEEFKETKSVLPLRNKRIALMNLSDFESVILLSKRVIELDNGRNDIDFIFLGVAFWLLERPLEAIESWKDGLNTKYTDAAGGIGVPLLLLYASYILNDIILEKDAKSLIKKVCKNKMAQNWPGIIGKFMLEDGNEENLYNAISQTPLLREKELCQAKFFLGVKNLKNGERDKAVSSFWEATEIGTICYQKYEYYLAKYELEKIKNRA